MKPLRRILKVLFLVIVASAAFGQRQTTTPVPRGGVVGQTSTVTRLVPDQIILQHRAEINLDDDRQLLEDSGLRVLSQHRGSRMSVVRVDPARRDEVIRQLEGSGRYTFVEPDYIAEGLMIPNDPSYGQQWHLQTIQAPTAWDKTTGSSGVTIAFVDSGVEPTHPDLASKLVTGWSFLTSTTDTHDVLGHGTTTAGTAAAASNNAVGVTGIAWNNPIMPLVVLNSSNYATYSNIANAIMYAADHGVRIVNVSIGGTSYSSSLENAVNYAWNKGTVVFASAGNGGSSTPMYPAGCTNAVAVGATTSSDQLASYSNYGSFVDLTAPGDSIFTTFTGGSYGYASGTSYSAPVAAAVAALVLSRNPLLSAQQLVSILEQTADDLGAAGYDQTFGWGRVNAARAVAAAVTTLSSPPSVTISSPSPNTTVSGTVSVQGTVTASGGLNRVELWVDGAKVSSTTSSSYSLPWDTTTASNTAHSLAVIAYDNSGASGQSQESISVNNPVLDTTPPSVSVSTPAGNSTVSGAVPVQGSATDNVSVSQIQLFVDGALAATTNSSPFSFTWDATSAATGSHTLTVKATDPSGNAGQQAVTVNVSGPADTTPPSVSITSAVAFTPNSYTVKVSATDNVRVTQVSLYLDGVLYATSTTSPYSFKLDVKKVPSGAHNLTAKAWDPSGNEGVSAPVTITVR
jgi:thermitase